MKKRVKGVKLSRKRGARQALVKNLARGLILAERVKTTKARAKFAQKYVEKLVTLAKKDTLTAARRIFALTGNKVTTKKLISEIAPKFDNKLSGFTRVINLIPRRGDAAPMALLEFAYPQVRKLKKETEKSKEAKVTKEVKNSKKKS